MKHNQGKYFLAAMLSTIVMSFASLICLTGCGCGSGNPLMNCLSEDTYTSDAVSQDILPDTLPDNTPDGTSSAEDKKTFYEIYKPFGLSYDMEKDELTFDGEVVRCFWDGVFYDENVSAYRCNYFDEKGTVDIHTVRESVDNGDGSIDLFGNLTGIEKSSQKEFEERDLSEFYRTDMMEATTEVSDHSFWLSNLFDEKKSFSKIFKKYKKFGITYTEDSAGSGIGNVYYNGQLVNAFIDENNSGGVFSFHSAKTGAINVQTTYDSNGNLTGIQVTEAKK